MFILIINFYVILFNRFRGFVLKNCIIKYMFVKFIYYIYYGLKIWKFNRYINGCING